MTSNPAPSIRSFADEVFGPVEAPHGSTRRRLLLARSAVAWFGLIATVVQVVVWLMIGVLTEHLDTPWWLWTAVPAATAVFLLHLLANVRESA